MHQRISLKHWIATTSGLCRAWAAAKRWRTLRSVIVGGLTLFCLSGVLTASAAPACCAVTNITKSGEITARETNGEHTFQFQVTNPALLRALRVGSPVYANFDTKQVSLDGKKPCCTILNISTAAKQPAPGETSSAPKNKPSGTRAPKKQTTTVQVPKVDVTASEGSTATAIRGRPATPAAGRAVNDAFRRALAKSAVRRASETAMHAQLRTTSPIALVNGYWVIPIDLGRIYNDSTVRAALSPDIMGAIEGQHVGLVFIANEFADSFQIPRGDLSNMMGVNALQIKTTGSWLHPSGGGLNIMTALNWIGGAFNWVMAWWQNREADKSQKDCADTGPTGDCDDDGTDNEHDVCPFDPTCGGIDDKEGFVGCVIITCRIFTTQSGEQMHTAIQQVAQQIRHSKAANIQQLGLATAERPAISVAFPPSQYPN